MSRVVVAAANNTFNISAMDLAYSWKLVTGMFQLSEFGFQSL